MYDWNDLRYFLELSRGGKLVAAAKRLGVDHTTVSRRVAQLEQDLDARLFERGPRGYRLTETGLRLLPLAESMESQSLSLFRDVAGKDTAPRGAVRLATPEAFGSQFLAWRLPAFRDRHPGIELELVAGSGPLSLSKREADIAVMLARPTSGRLIAWKLGEYKLRLYGAPAYLENRPAIRTIEDLGRHDFIWYVDDLLPFEELRTLLSRTLKDPHVVFRSTSIAAQANACMAGLGLALLHCFHADRIEALTSILPREAAHSRELWLAVHEDLRHVARIDAVCDFLTETVTQNSHILAPA